MMVVADEKELYLEQQARLERQLASEQGTLLKDLRQAACASLEDLGLPTSRNEDWKFTSVASLVKTPFDLAMTPPAAHTLRPRLAQEEMPGAARLVFVNGRFVPEFSAGSFPQSVIAGSLAALADKHAAPHLAGFADAGEQFFTALNTAFLQDGAVVLIPKGAVLAQPIELVFASDPEGKPAMSHPRVLIVAGVNSQATIVERYLSTGAANAVYFTNAVTEIAIDENATVDHYKLQQEGAKAFHIASIHARQARSSNFYAHYFSLGGALVRNETRVAFTGEGSEATLNGLYLAGGTQHIDNFTLIDHAKPHCTSHELYKGILNDKAHGVFNGKIFVRQDAQKTDAKQTNQVLLLSEEATINTKPQLEIFADDVKCTHGATVGQLDADSIFYLRARGIGLNDARRLLTYAFANDIISRIKVEAIRDELERFLTSRQFTQGRS
jgi:Fe-S cluster assembly protein SufD